jgi:hypothetical protein
VTQIEGGIAAVATIRRLSDGAVLGQAEGFVGEDEGMWAKRPLYARRAMAQTRAISRACRSAFAHVVVAMNAGFGTNHSTTPAEEVPAEGFDDRPARATPGTAAGAAVASGRPSASAWTPEQKAEAADLARMLATKGKGKAAEEIRAASKNRDPKDVLNDLAAALEAA